jgi:hypothetical protein
MRSRGFNEEKYSAAAAISESVALFASKIISVCGARFGTAVALIPPL